MNYISNITRSKGDPKVLSTGPSSLGSVDRLGRALGWFSIGLGAMELLAPRSITRTLGMRGRERLVRAFGVREITAGILSLSVDRSAGLWSRVAGDGLDFVTVLGAYGRRNPKRDNVGLALIMLAGVATLDIVSAQVTTARHARGRAAPRDYSNRSGFPRGLANARGAAAARPARSGQPTMA